MGLQFENFMSDICSETNLSLKLLFLHFFTDPGLEDGCNPSPWLEGQCPRVGQRPHPVGGVERQEKTAVGEGG